MQKPPMASVAETAPAADEFTRYAACNYLPKAA